VADNSTSLTEDKLNQLTQELTFKFRNHALKYGWDFDVVSQIKVVWNENGISFDYPPSISSKVEALEYGENNSPSRAILTFQNSIGPEIVERFISILEDSLIDNGVFG
jgi:hypothetical protein